MMKLDRIALPAVILSMMLAAAGCGCGKSGTDGSKVLAKIGDYEMTVADFKDEVALTASNKYLPDDPARAKEELLDELIAKKILLKEAQAQNFDKDRAFMKEIERYWEQALLKLLMKKKSREFAEGIVIRDSDVRMAYERILAEEGPGIGSFAAMAPRIRKDIARAREEEAFEKWLSDLRKKTPVKINKKVLDEIRLR